MRAPAGPLTNILFRATLYIVAASISAPRLEIEAGLSPGLQAKRRLFTSLQRRFSGQLGMNDLGGPVMMVSTGAAMAHQAASLIQYPGFLSLNLALFNLAPVPALDGGQVLVTLATALSGRKPSDRVELAMMGGILRGVPLMGMAAWVTLQDVARLL